MSLTEFHFKKSLSGLLQWVKNLIIQNPGVAIVFLIGTWMRWSSLGASSLWVDEAFTANTVSLPVVEFIPFIQADTNPPFYYILLHGWVQVFGTSEWGLRSLSALFGTLCLPVAYLLARDLLRDRSSALLATGLLALSSSHIHHSRNARFYALFSFLLLLVLLLMFRLRQNRSRGKAALLIILLTLALYTLNVAFFYLPILACMWIFLNREALSRRVFLEVGVGLGIVVLLYLPWIPSLNSQVHSVYNHFWFPEPDATALIKSVHFITSTNLDFLGAVFQRVSERIGISNLSSVFKFSLVYLPVLFLLTVSYITNSGRDSLILITFYSFIPVFLVLIFSLTFKPILIPRLFISSVTTFPLLLAFSLAIPGARFKFVTTMLASVVVMMAALSSYASLHYKTIEDWRAATRYMLDVSKEPTLVIIDSVASRWPLQYYLPQETHGKEDTFELVQFDKPILWSVSHQGILESGNTNIQPLLYRSRGRPIIFVRRTTSTSNAEAIETAIADLGRSLRTVAVRRFVGVEIYLFEIGIPTKNLPR